jgi:hypothetical protein
MWFFGQHSNEQQWWPQPQLLPQLDPQPQLDAQPQLDPQPLLDAQPQLGAAAAAGAAHDASQAGAAAQQVFSQHFGWQQLLQPQPSRPNMRSSNSAPKLWPHRPTLRTSAPTTMFHFIEQSLL